MSYLFPVALHLLQNGWTLKQVYDQQNDKTFYFVQFQLSEINCIHIEESDFEKLLPYVTKTGETSTAKHETNFYKSIGKLPELISYDQHERLKVENTLKTERLRFSLTEIQRIANRGDIEQQAQFWGKVRGLCGEGLK